MRPWGQRSDGETPCGPGGRAGAGRAECSRTGRVLCRGGSDVCGSVTHRQLAGLTDNRESSAESKQGRTELEETWG